ncbi:hypothetical protein AVEN_80740-1 [Araneus ventricosus]|uniref:Uncharacterized protein n=1 Tax=Araneus ventricosus TaxID=182803 RepID=A0A4Y2QT80_ARAVE|nr:hypothetical protein AVEN_80740-1 [Araneus ventricosus]
MPLLTPIATRGLFCYGPRNFELQSDDEDDTPSPNFHATPTGDVWPLHMIQSATDPIHGGSSVESGFESGTLRPQCRDLTYRPRGLMVESGFEPAALRLQSRFLTSWLQHHPASSIFMASANYSLDPRLQAS